LKVPTNNHKNAMFSVLSMLVQKGGPQKAHVNCKGSSGLASGSNREKICINRGAALG
jgi:hypothetical protein